MTTLKLLSLAFALSLLAGCMSLDYHAEDNTPLVYPGVRTDYECIVHLPGKDPFWPFYTTYSAIDLPFSFVVDTLYFPDDVIEIQKYKSREHNPTIRNNKSANLIDTNVLLEPVRSPRQVQQNP